jgi:hypothetical protein
LVVLELLRLRAAQHSSISAHLPVMDARDDHVSAHGRDIVPYMPNSRTRSGGARQAAVSWRGQEQVEFMPAEENPDRSPVPPPGTPSGSVAHHAGDVFHARHAAAWRHHA